MTDDPAGHYATLDVDPGASPEAIAAAYRRKARVLHPDVPGTGDAAAFICVKAAYDVLSHPGRRAAYDRAARPDPPSFEPPDAASAARGPRLSDLPLGLWAALGGLFCLAAVMAVLQATRPAATPPPTRTPIARPLAPSAASTRILDPPTTDAAGGGPTTHYVLPTGDDAILWRHDPKRDAYVPAGHVAAFNPILALRFVTGRGLVEIRLGDGAHGFIDATRLEPGDRAAARRAYCAYYAGAPPRNGEVLAHRGNGPARIEIRNAATQPAVVKLRDMTGHVAAAVFVAPRDAATVADLPDAAYRPDYATGELWSRACGRFVAGIRAWRFTDYRWPSGLSPLMIPPDLSVVPPPADIPDAAFERE